MIQMQPVGVGGQQRCARSHVHQGARRLQAPLCRIGDVIKVEPQG